MVFVVLFKGYKVFSGKDILGLDIDVFVCVLFMGKLYYVMMGMVVVVIVVVVVISGMLVNLVVGGENRELVIFGYFFGILWVGVKVIFDNN